jgi:hypothetical protein
MSNTVQEHHKKHAAVLLPAVCSVLSLLLAVSLFSAVSGSLGLRSIISGAAVLIPQTVCIILLLRRTADTEQTGNRTAEPPYEEKIPDTPAPPCCIQPPVPPPPEPDEKRTAAERSIAIRSRLVRPVIGELCSSISRSLSSTTEPISAELLRIRQTSSDFLEGIRSYEDDVKNRRSISRLRNESSLFNRDLKELSGTVQDVFAALGKHIADLRTVSGRIGEISDAIGEISEQIRILSFNASIEAARAGNAGRGFRVIAGEIKRLSSDTESRLTEITATLNETNKIFRNIETGLEENKVKILDVVAQRQTGFDVLERTLGDYFPKLEKLYTGITDIIASLSKSMDVISPVVQLHEITSQEVGNLGLVSDDFCRYVGEKASGDCPPPVPEPGTEDAQETAVEIRRRLTTERELEALGRGIRESVPEADIDLGINSRGIELF